MKTGEHPVRIERGITVERETVAQQVHAALHQQRAKLPQRQRGSQDDGCGREFARARNLASPVPDPVGIAFDGQMLWIMGSVSDTTATLVRFNPDSLAVDRSFTFDNLQSPGSSVYGITWDGAAIWISISGGPNKLVRIDPATGAITRTMSSPAWSGPSDLDFFDGMTDVDRQANRRAMADTTAYITEVGYPEMLQAVETIAHDHEISEQVRQMMRAGFSEALAPGPGARSRRACPWP